MSAVNVINLIFLSFLPMPRHPDDLVRTQYYYKYALLSQFFVNLKILCYLFF